ncbi:MAG TPA: hypothetical protein VG537_08250 [Candidatus Kapabacteria bacterium]|jgi:hypothetical protein|nr:hypothetical protein [Candidatus Kapabacteria bacterium]
MWYTIFVILHIISVGFAIGLVGMAIIGTSLRKKIMGTPAELAAIRSAATILPVMGMIASVGILVTGAVMTIMSYAWFPFSSLPWLAIKQTVFIILLVVVIASLRPRGDKILAKATAELTGPSAMQGASAELRALVNRQYATTLFVGLLVLINISLGESKAMMWLAGQ